MVGIPFPLDRLSLCWNVFGQNGLEITGPESLSYAEAAAILAEVTHQPIAYPNPTPEEYAATLKSAGAPDFIATYMISVYSLIANDKVNIVLPAAEQLTGRKPGTLRAVLERDFG